MKKLMTMAVLLCMALAANAQNPAGLKQVMSCKNYQEAAAALKGAVQSMSNDEKAKAYNKLVDLSLEVFNKEQNIKLTNQALKKEDPYDKKAMYESALNALVNASECDKYDQLPNAKGKVAPKFRKKNAERLLAARTELINGGQELYNEKNFTKAAEYFGTYVDSRKYPLFAETDFSNDTYYGQIAYFAALAAYNCQDFANASKYADAAQGDKEVANDAMDIKILSMKAQLKTKEDSLKYLDDVKALYAKEPANERIFALLVEYYSSVNDDAAKNALVAKQVAEHPSKMAWALKGESDMRDSKWVDAIEAYKKSLELDPEFIQVRFNLGLCMNNQAITLKDQNGGNLVPEAKSLLEQSIQNLLKVKEQDPNREQVNWAYTLYQAYYLIGNEEKAKELESLIQ
jgi:hypothetical protein